MEKVTGIGGVFLKANDPKLLTEWYQKHLGISFNGNDYVSFTANKSTDKDDPEVTVFSFFKKTTEYFNPSEKMCMINFRVNNLVALIDTLKNEGVSVIGDILDEGYGKFGWIMDPEGNKIELWQPH